MSWERPFHQPVPLPTGRPARTLRDAANYIKTLQKSEYDRPAWRLAMHMLIDAAEDRGPMLFARIGMLRAFESDPTPHVAPKRPQRKTSPGGSRRNTKS